MRTTILYTVHNNYLVFRASVESLLAHVPRGHYAKLLIVDDCSSDVTLLGFLDRLASDLDFVEVVRAGEPADLSYYNAAGGGGRRACAEGDGLRGDRRAGDERSLGGRKVSKGHGESANIGLGRVGTEFVLMVDSDILFMGKSRDLLPGMEACMDLDPAIMSVGALVNRVDGVRVFDRPFNIRDSGDNMPVLWEEVVAPRGAWPSQIAGLMRMSGWAKHGLPTFNNGGWIGVDYALAIFERGLKTCNFNVFRDGYLIHLGYATLRETRNQPHSGFSFSRDKNARAKRMGWWYGHHRVPHTTGEFQRLLESAYAGADFSTRRNVVTFDGEV